MNNFMTRLSRFSSAWASLCSSAWPSDGWRAAGANATSAYARIEISRRLECGDAKIVATTFAW